MDILTRPQINYYNRPEDFLLDMIEYRKKNDVGFSVALASKSLRRVSPTLVSLIKKGERRITIDRIDEFSTLMNLNPSEKSSFKKWVISHLTPNNLNDENSEKKMDKRKTASVSLLNDWLNVYVKDMFQLPQVRDNPNSIFSHLSGIAPIKRIERSISFLLREGYLRKTLAGKFVLETELSVADTRVPSDKIRSFHKNALKIAQKGIDQYSSDQRFANTMTLPMNKERYDKLLHLFHDFAESLQGVTDASEENMDSLYQVTVTLCPIGKKV